MTVTPQIAATVRRIPGLAPNSRPMTRQHVPLAAMAMEVTAVRPARSAARPPATQPIAPDPMTRKDEASASRDGCPPAVKLARRKTGTHAHIA
jgi:hypothetical protein